MKQNQRVNAIKQRIQFTFLFIVFVSIQAALSSWVNKGPKEHDSVPKKKQQLNSGKATQAMLSVLLLYVVSWNQPKDEKKHFLKQCF